VGTGFEHPSRPHQGATRLDAETQKYVALLAAAYFPGSADYPDGRRAQVAAFVAERATEEDARLLGDLARRRPASSVADAADVLRGLETGEAELFGYLAVLLCHGYYSAHRVLAAMADRGYAYHGAPQPLGYPSSGELMRPSTVRGSHLRTEEVARATVR
jgi:hypothetical protein